MSFLTLNFLMFSSVSVDDAAAILFISFLFGHRTGNDTSNTSKRIITTTLTKGIICLDNKYYVTHLKASKTARPLESGGIDHIKANLCFTQNFNKKLLRQCSGAEERRRDKIQSKINDAFDRNLCGCGVIRS